MPTDDPTRLTCSNLTLELAAHSGIAHLAELIEYPSICLYPLREPGSLAANYGHI